MSFCLMVAATAGAAPEVPRPLSALLSAQKETRPVAAWCSGELRAGRTAFAVALAARSVGGTYHVIEAGETMIQLATFAGEPSLDCYSRAQAEELDASIRKSETIHGQVEPRWNTTVVCGFTDATTAICWQYSPSARAFVVVGRWIT